MADSFPFCSSARTGDWSANKHLPLMNTEAYKLLPQNQSFLSLVLAFVIKTRGFDEISCLCVRSFLTTNHIYLVSTQNIWTSPSRGSVNLWTEVMWCKTRPHIHISVTLVLESTPKPIKPVRTAKDIKHANVCLTNTYMNMLKKIFIQTHRFLYPVAKK